MKLLVEGLVDDIRGQIAQMEEAPTEEQVCFGLSGGRCGLRPSITEIRNSSRAFLSSRLATFSIISNTLMDCHRPD